MNQQQELALAFLQKLAVDSGVQDEKLFVEFLNNLILILNLDLDILNNPDDIVKLADNCEQAQKEHPQEFELAAALAANPDVPMGRFGMKVYNLMRLRGVCPPGSLVSYYKVGGKVCKKCVKKQEAGGKTKRNTGTSIEDYKEEYAQRKADYANLYRHLQSKSVGGAIDAQPKYSGKGPNGISKHRGGGSLIQRFEPGGKPGILETIYNGIKRVAESVGNWFDGVMRAIFVGPNGEIIVNPDPNPDPNVMPTPPSGYRPISQEEAIAVLNHFADRIAPYYDTATGAYIGPASAQRTISLYEHMPADTLITVYPQGGTYGSYPIQLTNHSVDRGRRTFDYYNSQFPNDAPASSTRNTRASSNSNNKSTSGPSAQPHKSADTLRVEIVNGQALLVPNN